METVDIVQQLKNEGRDEGRREGRDEGRREGRDEGQDEALHRALLSIYRARFGAVPDDVAAVLERNHDLRVLDAWTELFATRRADEIAAALTAKR